MTQPKFGQKILRGKLVTHLREGRIVEGVRSMHEQGMSLRAIASTLSKMNVPTKCQGKGWHPQMVKRILAENRPAASLPNESPNT